MKVLYTREKNDRSIFTTEFPVERIRLTKDTNGLISISFICEGVSNNDPEWFRMSASMYGFYKGVKGVLPLSLFLSLNPSIEEPVQESVFELGQNYTIKTVPSFCPINYSGSLIYEQTFLGMREKNNLVLSRRDRKIELGIAGTPEEIIGVCELIVNQLMSLEPDRSTVIKLTGGSVVNRT